MSAETVTMNCNRSDCLIDKLTQATFPTGCSRAVARRPARPANQSKYMEDDEGIKKINGCADDKPNASCEACPSRKIKRTIRSPRLNNHTVTITDMVPRHRHIHAQIVRSGSWPGKREGACLNCPKGVSIFGDGHEAVVSSSKPLQSAKVACKYS